MAMEWPDAAHAVFAELPTEHRVAALYVILAIGGVAVLMAIRKLLASAAVPAAAPPGPPVNVQLVSFDQALAAVRGELRAQLNGSLKRIEEKQDAFDAKLDALERDVGEKHAENQREIGEISGLLKALDRPWRR